MKLTLYALAFTLAAVPAGAVMNSGPKDKTEPPAKEQPESKPEPKAESKAATRSETRSTNRSRETRESECPYTRLKENNYACVGFRPKARPRPITNQVVPAGELK